MALRPNRVLLIAFFLLCFLPCSLSAAVPPVPDQPANYVVDLAGIIDSQTQADLNRRLKELEDQTTAQVVVLTLNSLEGEPMEKFSLRTAEKWALGQKGKDNGVLITVALTDRKYRIEVGYGLEAILPDSFVGSIGRDCFVSNFRRGNYSTGISEAVEKITGQIIGYEAGRITEVKKISFLERTSILTIFWFLFVLVFIFVNFIAFLFSSDKRNDKKRSSEASSGGFWGGFVGGGGFGGGGGGGFGGGGAGGGW
jgi:uncharacterized protein